MHFFHGFLDELVKLSYAIKSRTLGGALSEARSALRSMEKSKPVKTLRSGQGAVQYGNTKEMEELLSTKKMLEKVLSKRRAKAERYGLRLHRRAERKRPGSSPWLQAD